MDNPEIDIKGERWTGVSVDKVISTELKMQGMDDAEGLIPQLYEAAQAEEGDPLTYAAAKSLKETVDDGDTVIVTGGAGVWPRLPHGETDGPLGAAAIAGTLALACNARPVILTEERNLESYENSARACGFNIVSMDELYRREISRYPAVSIDSFPEDQEAGEEAAKQLYEEHEPSAIIGVEKIGPNSEETYHTWYGAEHIGRAKIAPLFDLVNESDGITIGFGDGGNEIGFGKIEEKVRELHPHGDVCQCPCGGGVATRVSTDHLVVGGTSNWAAYGTAAMLAILEEEPEAFHSPEDEDRMLEWNALAGSSDGMVSRPLPMVDGTDKETSIAIVQILNNIISNRFNIVDRVDAPSE